MVKKRQKLVNVPLTMFPFTVFCKVIQNLSYSTSLLITYCSFFFSYSLGGISEIDALHFFDRIDGVCCSIFRILWDVKSQWCSDFSDFFRPSCLLYSYLNGMKCIIWLVLFSRCGMLVFITQYDEKVTYLNSFFITIERAPILVSVRLLSF